MDQVASYPKKGEAAEILLVASLLSIAILNQFQNNLLYIFLWTGRVRGLLFDIYQPGKQIKNLDICALL